MVVLDSWDGFLPWQTERHRHVQLCSEASSFALGGVLGPETISAVTSDYRPDSHLHCDTATKEPLALANVLESSASSISNSWVDVFSLIACDGMAVISAWDRQGFRSHPIVIPSREFLGNVKTRETLRFPSDDGFLFNHIWGKNASWWHLQCIWYSPTP